MNRDLPKQDISLKKVLFKLKEVIAGLFLVIIGLSFWMAKAHPKKVSHGKEYSYIYSMIATGEADRYLNYDLLEQKVDLYGALRPIADFFFLKKSLKEKNYLKATSLLEEINKRVAWKSELLQRFSNSSIAVESENIDRAYQNALAISDSKECSEKYPFLYGYNLYRAHILEEMQEVTGGKPSLKGKLNDYIESLKDSEIHNHPLLKKIQSSINNT